MFFTTRTNAYHSCIRLLYSTPVNLRTLCTLRHPRCNAPPPARNLDSPPLLPSLPPLVELHIEGRKQINLMAGRNLGNLGIPILQQLSHILQ